MLCIKNGTIHTAVSPETFIGDILVEEGKIVRIGTNLRKEGSPGERKAPA